MVKKSQKSYYVHRFVWECFNGLIPEDKVIDHINNNKENNRLCNLQLIAQKENCEKSAKTRDYALASKNHNKKCVKAINQNREEVTYYNSLYAAQQHLGINAGIVKMVCERINKCKTGILKKDGYKYKFWYVQKENLPANCKKSAKVASKVTDEDKKKHLAEANK